MKEALGNGDYRLASPLPPMTMDPRRHCFRETSLTDDCEALGCGFAAEAHTGCDCP